MRGWGRPKEPDMMVLERRLTPSSGHLGGAGLGGGAGTADSRPEEERDGYLTAMSGRQPIHQPRERNQLPDMMASRDPRHPSVPAPVRSLSG